MVSNTDSFYICSVSQTTLSGDNFESVAITDDVEARIKATSLKVSQHFTGIFFTSAAQRVGSAIKICEKHIENEFRDRLFGRNHFRIDKLLQNFAQT